MYNLLFILIGAVLTSNEVKAGCRIVTLISLLDQNCHKKLSPEAKDILEANPFSDNEEILQFYTCSLHNKHFLIDGKFHLENMKNFIDQRVVLPELRLKIYKRFKIVVKDASHKRNTGIAQARNFAELLHGDKVLEHLLNGYHCDEH